MNKNKAWKSEFRNSETTAFMGRNKLVVGAKVHNWLGTGIIWAVNPITNTCNVRFFSGEVRCFHYINVYVIDDNGEYYLEQK